MYLSCYQFLIFINLLITDLSYLRSRTVFFICLHSGITLLWKVVFSPIFKMQCHAFHRIASPRRRTNVEPPFYCHIFWNFQVQAIVRNSISVGTRLKLTLTLQDMIHYINSYVKSFNSAAESATTNNYILIIDEEKRPTGQHPGRFQWTLMQWNISGFPWWPT